MKLRAVAAALLIVAVMGSAVAMVNAKHVNRKLFVQLQDLERQRDALDVEWGKLTLERATWATQERIDAIARERLGLTTPAADAVVLMTP